MFLKLNVTTYAVWLTNVRPFKIFFSTFHFIEYKLNLGLRLAVLMAMH